MVSAAGPVHGKCGILRVLLLFVILCGGFTGCTTEYFAPLGTYEFRNQDPKDIMKIRFFNYNFAYNDYDFGETPPTHISTYNKKAGAEGRYYIQRQINTKKYTYKYRLEIIALVFYIIFVSAFYLILGISIFDFFTHIYEGKKKYTEPIIILVLGVFLILPTSLFGYLSGSVYYIDNASNEKVNVYINNRFCAEIPARSFIETRISGSENLFTVKDAHNNSIIESVDFKTDGRNETSLMRYFYHYGAYIYTIRADNTITYGAKTYIKR